MPHALFFLPSGPSVVLLEIIKALGGPRATLKGGGGDVAWQPHSLSVADLGGVTLAFGQVATLQMQTGPGWLGGVFLSASALQRGRNVSVALTELKRSQ